MHLLLLPRLLAAEPLVFPTTADAVAYVLAANPKILGVGEVHATTGGPAIPTTLSRFTADVLPVLATRTTDLVLETWRLDGTCGATEEKVTTKVEKETKRPEVVKSELELLVEKSVALNVRPHDLAISCAEYASMLDASGQVDYGVLLTLLTGKLRDFALLGLQTPDATVVLYGGAVHNDLYPRPELASYSYGPAVRDAGGGTYVELDLYAPELVRGNASLVDAAWADQLDRAGPDHVLLIARGPQSWVLVLPTTPTGTP